MFLFHIQAEMVSTGTSPTNQCPHIQDVSLTHPGRNKHLPQTNAQYTLCRMFLLHIQAEMVPTGTSPTNQCPVCYLQRCFSYTSRLKRCRWQTSPTKPCPDLYGMFLLHIQAQTVPRGTLPIHQFPECYLQDVSLTHPG